MDFKDLTITVKNCPLQVSIMLQTALIDVPRQLGYEQIILQPEGLTVDFEKITEEKEHFDVLRACNLLIMAHGFQILKDKENEKQPD